MDLGVASSRRDAQIGTSIVTGSCWPKTTANRYVPSSVQAEITEAT